MPEAPALRLARYLKEFVALRATTVRDLSNYETVLWFADMPQERDCFSGAWVDKNEPGDPWLEVKKQEFESPPSAPKIVRPWVDEMSLKQAAESMPPLRQTILVPNEEIDTAEGEPQPLMERALADHPEVQRAYDSYRSQWENWSNEQRRREAIQKVYADLFHLHTQIRKQGEILEVVLGLGLLDWCPEINGPPISIRRHVAVARVEVKFEPAEGLIRIEPPGDSAGLRIEDDMLEAQLRPSRTHYDSLKRQLEELGDEIWNKVDVHKALKEWLDALSADASWQPLLSPQPRGANGPVMSFAPALILRKRAQTGMVRIYETIINQLAEDSPTIPKGWHGLTDDVGDDEGSPNVDLGERIAAGTRTCSPATEVYFPLATNREQRRIVEAIDRNRGVLVQGPPGTGKSHTIANMICHLLATGKRVLITAETARALQVLKDKLPKELRPLCVSLLGQGGDAFAELNSAVQGITLKYDSYSSEDNEARVTDTDQQLDESRREVAKIDSEIRSLREDETSIFSIANDAYQGSASTIAKGVAQDRERYNWLQLAIDASGKAPLSNEEITSWFSISRAYSNEQISQAELRIPSSRELPSPNEFAEAVQTEKECAASVGQQVSQISHVAYPSLQALAPDLRSRLADYLHRLEQRRRALDCERVAWIKSAAMDLIGGQRAKWDTVIELTKERLIQLDELLSRLGPRVVAIANNLDLCKVRADAVVAIAYLRNGRRWKRFGLLTPKELTGRTYLQTEVLVDGTGASQCDALQNVCNHVDIELALADLRTAWANVPDPPDDADRRVFIAVLRERLLKFAALSDFAEGCRKVAQFMVATNPPIPEPDWLNGEAQEWGNLIRVAADEDRWRDATRNVNCTMSALAGLRELHDAHPVVHALVDAVKSRDANAYSANHEKVISVEKLRSDQEKRQFIEEVLSEALPGFVECVNASQESTVWYERLGEWEKAWNWALADAWLKKRSNLAYQQGLWSKRREIEIRIGRLIAEAASIRAWTHFFNRLSAPERAALKSWRAAVQAMGKGTGRSARMARLRQEARQYMDRCRDAIPVWIMPRYLVAEMVNPAPGRYDLVIVDEASQLGIESLFLFYIAEKMVVVGDDQQISPYGIGIPDEAIAGLQDHYLGGILHHHALSAQSSLYGNAKIRFSKNIVLREHFRCMPEIIQFSNDLCYASNGTPLDPLRAYPSNRLKPLVLRYVADGYRIGGPQSAENPPEADAIVAQIAACVEDPRYAGLTMGVISLQGEAQAKRIERKLLERLDPEVIEERRLTCGDAYAFQGDERKIIFLSMVAAPGETRIGALTNESARQRFNVAVSRAQDQLWLFHTATLDVLSNQCMRYRLLSYMLNPTRRITEENEQRFESDFERDVFRLITGRGFHVRTQVCVGDPTNHRYRIDLVVEGMQGRLAVECDGDKWHGPDRYEHDMARQRDLERAGWQFARIRGGDFYRDPESAMKFVWAELDRLGIRPGGIDETAAEPPPPMNDEATESSERIADDHSVNEVSTPDDVEQSVTSNLFSGASSNGDTTHDDGQGITDTNLEREPHSLPPRPNAPFEESPEPRSLKRSLENRKPYKEFAGAVGPDPRQAATSVVADGLCRIIEVEGPMLAKRAYEIYLRGCGIRRMGGELKRLMNKSLQHAIRRGQVFQEDELAKRGLVYSTVRTKSAPPVVVRDRGPRDFEEIPASELQLVARRLLMDDGLEPGSDAHLRKVLEFFDLKRLTVQVGTTLLEILGKEYPYVDEILTGRKAYSSDGIL